MRKLVILKEKHLHIYAPVRTALLTMLIHRICMILNITQSQASKKTSFGIPRLDIYRRF
jgi:hypothetical protein